jgi:hypothetical protein
MNTYLSESVKINKAQKPNLTVIYACKMWFPQLPEDLNEELDNYQVITSTHPQTSLGRSNQGESGGRDMWHTWERRGKCTGFWCEIKKERDHLEDQGVCWRIGSEWILGRLADGGGG